MRITIIRQPDHHLVPLDELVALLESSRSGRDALVVLRCLRTMSSPSHPATGSVRRVTCCADLAELMGITPSNVRDALQRLSDAQMIAMQIGVAEGPCVVEVRLATQLRLGPPAVLAKLPTSSQRSIIDVLAGQITERI